MLTELLKFLKIEVLAVSSFSMNVKVAHCGQLSVFCSTLVLLVFFLTQFGEMS